MYNVAPSFWEIENDDDHFQSAMDLLCHFFNDGKPVLDENEFWQRLQNIIQYPFDPLQIIPINYRPWDTKYLYYSDKMGMVSHPRFTVMQHLLPWYCRYSVKYLANAMAFYTVNILNDIILKAEDNWFWEPLNAKFLANLNIWRTAICLKSVYEKQLSLF